MTITRKQRTIGFLINLITLNGLIIGNLILLLSSGKTVGGLVAGYKYQEGGAKVVMLYFTKMLATILYFVTFGIFWIFDVVTLEKRDGTFAESWAGNLKVSN